MTAQAPNLAATSTRGMTPEQREKAGHAARQWVGQIFFGTILKQMRSSPFKDELFSGGRGGDAFQSLHDQMLAERMAHDVGRRLSDSIVKHIEKNMRKGGAAQ